MKRILCLWILDRSAGRGLAARPGPEEPPGDREIMDWLAAWCERYAPIVGLEDSPRPESLLLDITGLEHLVGSEAALAWRIAGDLSGRPTITPLSPCGRGAGGEGAATPLSPCGRKAGGEGAARENHEVIVGRPLKRLGFPLRGAVADTLGAAWAVAHFGEGGSRNSSLIPHPSSLVIVPPGGAMAALRPLPIEALRLPDEVVQACHPLGIYQVGQLEPLDRGELALRFGPRLIERMDQAEGRMAEPIPARQPPPELEAHQSLEYPTTHREAIEFFLEQLIGRVSEMLICCGRGATELVGRLDCPPAPSVTISVGLFQPTASPRHLGELLRMQLERLELPAPVAAVHVRAERTAPLPCRQEELFFCDAPSRQRPRQLAGLVDRLSSRLGRQAVLRPALVCEAQPELAYRYEPLLLVRSAGFSPSPRKHGLKPALQTQLPPRPLRLLPQPIAVSVVSVLPDGPPFRFCWQGRDQRIVQSWGPERIETGWWHGRPVGRDYYRVETAGGSRFWLFRRLYDGRWFVHGTFE